MDKVLYQGGSDMRVVERDNKLYQRYDIGAHCSKYREDEITQKEFESQGIDPHKSNYSLSQYDEEEKS